MAILIILTTVTAEARRSWFMQLFLQMPAINSLCRLLFAQKSIMTEKGGLHLQHPSKVSLHVPLTELQVHQVLLKFLMLSSPSS